MEKLAVGPLEQLLPYIPGLKPLHAKGSYSNFTTQPAGKASSAAWFTKSTLNRFLIYNTLFLVFFLFSLLFIYNISFINKMLVPVFLLWHSLCFLLRFLNIVGSPDLVNITKIIEGEMSQLEEARQFHLSLYVQVNISSLCELILEGYICSSKEVECSQANNIEAGETGNFC